MKLEVASLNTSNRWRERIFGLDSKQPLLNGRLVPYVNLDNAASTPPLRDVVEAVERFLPYYSSVHRGTGFKSRVSTVAYDQAHETIGRFVGADMDTNTVIFGKNTTEAINKLSFRYPFRAGDIVVSTMMEHHSNDLPWRNRAQVVRAGVTSEGRLDEDDLDRLLARYGDRIALITVSGASNVTGFVQPIHRLARKAHAVGARILVDAAQLAPHRRIDIKADDDPEHIDFVVLSAHKMYAPFGTGALVGSREIFLEGAPEYQGGGTVALVTNEEVRWAGLPDRDEAGSPNVVGAVAMAVAARALMSAGLESVQRHESWLTAYALERLRSVPEITIYGSTDRRPSDDRVGVIPFNLGSAHHALVAAVMSYEGGIGLRNGCFCAQPYVMRLLGLSDAQQLRWQHEAQDKSQKPGMVRASFGVYNTIEDVEALVEMLHRITRNEYKGEYQQDADTGEYIPVGYQDSIADYFSLDGPTVNSASGNVTPLPGREQSLVSRFGSSQVGKGGLPTRTGVMRSVPPRGSRWVRAVRDARR